MKKTILYVDDDPDDQAIFKECISSFKWDLQCIIAGDGQQALQRLASMPANPECIFIDMNMPVLNGKEFLAIVKADRRFDKIPCFILSTSKYEPVAYQAIALGAEQYLVKPANFTDYCLLMKGILHHYLT